MALAYTNVSVSGASAAAASTTVQTNWRNALTGHASGKWTLVEEFTSGGLHWVVVKNTAGADVDFHVCIGRRISDGAMGVMVGEEYVAAGNVLSKYAPQSGDLGTILAGGDYGYPSAMAYTLGSTWPPNDESDPLFQGSASAATQRMVTCVDSDYAILNFNGNSFYVGAMTDLIVPKTGLVATPAIAMCNLMQGVEGQFGALTNHPIAAADAPMAVYRSHTLKPIMASQNVGLLNVQHQALITALYGFADRYQNDRVAASEIAGIMAAAGYGGEADNTAAKVGALRAKFKGLRWATGPKAAVEYDTIVVDSKKAVVLHAPGSLGAWNPYVYFLYPIGYDDVVAPMLVADTGVAV